MPGTVAALRLWLLKPALGEVRDSRSSPGALGLVCGKKGGGLSSTWRSKVSAGLSGFRKLVRFNRLTRLPVLLLLLPEAERLMSYKYSTCCQHQYWSQKLRVQSLPEGERRARPLRRRVGRSSRGGSGRPRDIQDEGGRQAHTS